MGGHFRPVKVREIEAVLKHLRFTPEKQRATSHQHWRGQYGGKFRKVTVDANNAPFVDRALKYMLDQIGISKADFFATLDSL